MNSTSAPTNYAENRLNRNNFEQFMENAEEIHRSLPKKLRLNFQEIVGQTFDQKPDSDPEDSYDFSPRLTPKKFNSTDSSSPKSNQRKINQESSERSHSNSR